MQTARERGAAALSGSLPAPARTSLGGALLAVAAAVFTAGALFFSGGSSDHPPAGLGGGAVAVAAAAVAAASLRLLPWPAPSTPALVFFGFLAAFLVWNGVSILWSIAPGRSWNYFNRGLAYAGSAVIGLFVGALVP